ncbi:hypothetical protein F5888DRAFT_1206021 [Russula emetica]|nr:hypothetical protein F5888DRAFT_1206021 [Russula emetica]
MEVGPSTSSGNTMMHLGPFERVDQTAFADVGEANDADGGARFVRLEEAVKCWGQDVLVRHQVYVTIIRSNVDENLQMKREKEWGPTHRIKACGFQVSCETRVGTLGTSKPHSTSSLKVTDFVTFNCFIFKCSPDRRDVSLLFQCIFFRLK